MRYGFWSCLLVLLWTSFGSAFPVSPYPGPEPGVDYPLGAIAYYPFNNNSINVVADRFHGTVYGAATALDRFGHANSAYYFDGLNDYINMGSIPRAYDYVSVSAWFKTTKAINNYVLFDWNTPENDGALGVAIGCEPPNIGSPPGVIDSAFHDAVYPMGDEVWQVNKYLYPRLHGTSNVADGEWHQVVFTYDGDAHIYVDGQLEGTRDRNSVMLNFDQLFYVGHLVNQPLWDISFRRLSR